jgi:hypothetical protein
LGREGGRYGIEEYLEIKYVCMGGLQWIQGRLESELWLVSVSKLDKISIFFLELYCKWF